MIPIRKLSWWLAAFLCVGAAVANAAPPSPGSEDAELMADFADWVKAQHAGNGRLCCDIADGRPLHDDEIRRQDGKTEVFISRRHWANAPEPGQWMVVPGDAIVHASNPLGMPIVWFFYGTVRCFIDGNGA